MKDTTISLKIERALKAKLLVLAKNENRSLSNFIEKLLKDEVARHEGKSSRTKASNSVVARPALFHIIAQPRPTPGDVPPGATSAKGSVHRRGLYDVGETHPF